MKITTVLNYEAKLVLFQSNSGGHNWSYTTDGLYNQSKSEQSNLTYRKVSNIRRAKCQNLNDSRLVLQLSVPNPLKPSIESIMKM